MRRRTPFLLVLIAVTAVITTSCSSLAVAAATVNGHKITESEVESELDTLRADPVFGEALKSDPDQRGQRRREILRELIYQSVAEQEARRMRVRVTQGQADQLIKQTARARGTTVAKLLETENLSLSEARKLALRGVRRFALIDRVVSQVKVPDSSIRQVYEGQRDRFVEVHLERITVKTEKEARAIASEVDGGASFSRLARERSTDDLKREGGDMGDVPMTALDVTAQEAVGRAVTGGLTDPIAVPTGFEIYRLVDRTTKTFEDVKDEIRQALSQDERDQRYQAWLSERVRSAKIVVNPKYGRLDKAQQEPTVVPARPELPK